MHAGNRGWGDPSVPGYWRDTCLVEVDGAVFRVHKAVEHIFREFLTRLCEENHYHLNEFKDDWSFIVRPIRGYEQRWELTRNLRYLSNHSWGLAVDVNSTTNPLHADLITDLPVEWIKANVEYYKLRWGGTFAGRKDAMHFEFMGTPEDASRITYGILNPPEPLTPAMESTMAKLDAEDLGNIKKIVDAETNEIYHLLGKRVDEAVKKVLDKLNEKA